MYKWSSWVYNFLSWYIIHQFEIYSTFQIYQNILGIIRNYVDGDLYGLYNWVVLKHAYGSKRIGLKRKTQLILVKQSIWLCLLSLQSNDEIDFLMLWKPIFYGVFVFGVVFCAWYKGFNSQIIIKCDNNSVMNNFSSELGQRLSNLFEGISGVFDQVNCYLLPNRIQRLLPTLIMNVQEPVVIKCFGSVSCSRDQFKKVSRIDQLSFECDFWHFHENCVFLLGGELGLHLLHDSSQILWMSSFSFASILLSLHGSTISQKCSLCIMLSTISYLQSIF